MADSTLTAVNPAAQLNSPTSLDGRILSVANGVLPDADTSYLYVGLAKDGYNLFTLDFILQATTVTIEASNDKPDVVDASAHWVDITNVCTSGSSTNFTATGTLTVAFPIEWSRLRFKRVTTNATNSCIFIMTRGRF